jgi:hypothetical protein
MICYVMSGKWDQPGVPHKGWICINVHDLGEPSAICEMCEVQEIRYVHTLEHPDYPTALEVGCVCAEHMEGDYVGPRRREATLKNAAARRARWLTRQWKMSAKGNPYLNVDGINIVLFQLADGSWSGRITNRPTQASETSRRRYASLDEAKLAAFDGMVFLRKERGWGY